MYAEYAGLTSEAITLIEKLRLSPTESKSDILVRVLSRLVEPAANEQPGLDLGQGARLHVGEKPMLFLSQAAKRSRIPDAVGEVKADGFYLDGKKIRARKGNPLQPAMSLVQERKNHRNDKGELISLSAWRQWHVVREGKLCSVLELKDPNLAHRRGRLLATSTDLTPEQLGL